MAKITNILLEKDRFKVFASFDNGTDEVNTFMPEVVASDILIWLQERITYYQELKDKELALQEELIAKEYNLEIFNELYETDPEFRDKVDEAKGKDVKPK